MAKASSERDERLTATEVTYLVGAIFHDNLRRLSPLRAARRSRALANLCHADELPPRSEAARAAGFASVAEMEAVIARFDDRFSAQRMRYTIGKVLIESDNFSAQALRLALDIVMGRVSGKKPIRKPTGTKARKALAGGVRLEAWDAEDERFEVPIDEHGESAPRNGLKLEAWDDKPEPRAARVAKPAPVARASRVLQAMMGKLEAWDDKPKPSATRVSKSAPVARASEAQQATISAWLESIGQSNSGITIESVIPALMVALPAAAAQMSISAIGKDAPLEALDALLDGLAKARVAPAALVRLRRLRAIVALKDGVLLLPERVAAPVYTPEPRRVMCLFHMRFPYETNGYVTRSQLILTSLRAAGLEPHAATRPGYPQDLGKHKGKAIPALEVIDGIPYHALPDDLGGMHGRGLDQYIYDYADRIEALARELKPAVLHAASNYINGLAAIIAGRRLGIPVIYEVRGIWEITQASLRKGYGDSLRYKQERAMENLAVREADRVLCISKQLGLFTASHGVRRELITVVPNGVDLAEHHRRPHDPQARAALGLPEDALVVGYIGSVVQYEGIDLIIDALAKAKGMTRPLHFVLVGDGLRLEALKALAEKRGLADACHFLGRKPREEVEALYGVMDVIALPRRSLPVTEIVPPLKPFEAMAHAKVVIVSDVAAIAETVIDGQTGMIVKNGSATALARAFEKLAADPVLCRTLGEQGYSWVSENRTAESLGQVLGGVYQDLGVELSSSG